HVFAHLDRAPVTCEGVALAPGQNANIHVTQVLWQVLIWTRADVVDVGGIELHKIRFTADHQPVPLGTPSGHFLHQWTVHYVIHVPEITEGRLRDARNIRRCFGRLDGEVIEVHGLLEKISMWHFRFGE